MYRFVFRLFAILFLITIQKTGTANCFFDKLLIYAQQFDYPPIAIENDIEFELTFAVDDGIIWLVSTHKFAPLELLQKISNFSRVHNCKPERMPDTFMVKFQIDTADQLYIKNNTLVIQKKGHGYYWNDEIEIAAFSPNSKIIWNPKKDKCNIQIGEGNKLVFHYYWSKAENPMMLNDESFKEIYFQIPKGLTEFRFQNLEKIKLYHNSTGNPRCKKDKYKPQGLVTGKKLSNGNWQIFINYYAQVDTIFVLEE